MVALWVHADGTLVMRFSDTAAPFDPTLARRASDVSSLGGRGLKLVDSLSSRRRYAREHDRNVLELHFEAEPA